MRMMTVSIMLLFALPATAERDVWDKYNDAVRGVMTPLSQTFAKKVVRDMKRASPQNKRPEHSYLDPDYDENDVLVKPLQACMKPGNKIDQEVLDCMKGK